MDFYSSGDFSGAADSQSPIQVTVSGGAWEEGVGDVCVQGEILWCSVFFSCVCNLATWERKVLAILIRFHPNMPELG